MTRALIKQPKFWVSFIFIAGWLVASIIYYFAAGDRIPHPEVPYNKYGLPEKYPPYSPVKAPPLGSDNFNRNIFFVMLVGAKYTLITALLIALLRVCFGFIFGVLFRLYLPRLGKLLLQPFESFGVFPMALIAFFLLKWVIDLGLAHHPYPSAAYPASFRIMIYTIVLIAVAVPLVTATFYKMTDEILQREFFETTRILGGSRWHMLTKHFPPYLMPQFFIVFLRELIQVLILMAHLGVLDLFIGGASKMEPVNGGQSLIGSNLVYTGLINDWSALIGQYWSYIFTSYAYVALIPIIAMTLATLSAKGILSSVERAFNEKHDFLNDEKKAS